MASTTCRIDRRPAHAFLVALLVCALTALTWATSQAAGSAREQFEALESREAAVRLAMSVAPPADWLTELRSVARAYEGIVRQFPRSGYADNALWQGAALVEQAFLAFGKEADRQKAVRLLTWLEQEYPTSVLARRAPAERTRILGLAFNPTPPASGLALETSPGEAPVSAVGSNGGEKPPRPLAHESAAGAAGAVTVRQIRYARLPGVTRITIEMDGEVSYHDERVLAPPRMFIDLKKTRLAPHLVDAVFRYDTGAITSIRVGRHPGGVSRVVLDLDSARRYSVFTLYSPFRLVIDCETSDGAVPMTPRTQVLAPRTPAPAPAPRLLPSRALLAHSSIALPTTHASTEMLAFLEELRAPKEAAAAAVPAPNGPSSLSQGGFSIARQLGLGVSRIVIDPGHGGHDTGALGKGISESELVLDVALRLEKLLAGQPGLEVLLTRRANEYITLPDRTALANRESADLFLSIHANASVNQAARGVETYFLNLAVHPDAEAVAARENAGADGSMNRLPDILRTIVLNNKLDESRDLASTVQQALVERLRPANKSLRDLGVKQAPFHVLIGASMPSILAEIAFITNQQEAQLLRSDAYRQRIAEALKDGILSYQRALKRVGTVAEQ